MPSGDSTSLRCVPAPPIVSCVPATAGTCIQRAPPPALVRGCTSPLEGSPLLRLELSVKYSYFLIIKGISITFVKYTCIALKQPNIDIRHGKNPFCGRRAEKSRSREQGRLGLCPNDEIQCFPEQWNRFLFPSRGDFMRESVQNPKRPLLERFCRRNAVVSSRANDYSQRRTFRIYSLYSSP